MLFASVWDKPLMIVAADAESVVAPFAEALLQACNQQRARRHMRALELRTWHNTIPEDTDQPPISKADIDRHAEGATIELVRPPRRNTASAWAVVGFGCVTLGLLVLGVNFLSRTSSSVSPSTVIPAIVVVLGTLMFVHAWRKSRRRTVIDINKFGIVITRPRKWRSTRQQLFERDNIFSIGVTPGKVSGTGGLTLHTNDTQTKTPLGERDEAEAEWIAAVMRDCLQIPMHDPDDSEAGDCDELPHAKFKR
jgi:hypothetical protein